MRRLQSSPEPPRYAPHATRTRAAPRPRPWFAPANGETIPANAPALVWSGNDLATIALPGMDLSGERVDGVWILRPARAFTAGASYTVTFSDGSPNLTFDAGPVAKLPTTTGTLIARASKQQRIVVSAGASCEAEIDAAVVDVTFTPSREIEPWLPVTRFSAHVDGKLWVSPRYGSTSPPAPSPSFFMERRSLQRVHARCAPKADGVDTGVAPGHHTLTIAAHVAGATTDPAPVSVEFDLSCDGARPSDTSTADADDTSVGGCTCRVAQEQMATHAPLGLAGLIIAAGITRRRYRRRSA